MEVHIWADHDSGYSEALETKACLTSEKIVAPAPPRYAIQAFKFLSKKPAAQNIVASIVSYHNIWNAVLQNPDLQDFLQSHKSSASSLGVDSDAEKFVSSHMDWRLERNPLVILVE